MQLIYNVPICGMPDPGAVSQIKTCAQTADEVALMADHHKGYAVPTGGLVAYTDAISPSGVGFDIACGNKVVRVEGVESSQLRASIREIMDQVWSEISFGIGRKNDERVDHPLFERGAHSGWQTEAAKPLKEMAHSQLGTVGSGHHYVDIFSDEQDRVRMGVHFGSLGLGHRTPTWIPESGWRAGWHGCSAVRAGREFRSWPAILVGDGPCREICYAGRDGVAKSRILNGAIVEEVYNHHNFARRETHDGEDYWVVRKGATPAFPGQRGFVGGTMGETSVILEGIENKNARHSLYRTVHGAGWVMGRLEAKGKVDRKTGEVKRAGKVTQDMMDGWVKRAGVELRGAGLDESPDCYKRLGDVLNEHGGSIRVLHTLTPIGVAMAGANEHDPFKD
jgi:tRNA-splicing ligase RtcB